MFDVSKKGIHNEIRLMDSLRTCFRSLKAVDYCQKKDEE